MKAMHTATNDTDELQRAELAVEESRAELNRSLRRVSQSGEQLLNQVRAEMKPGLVFAAAAVGAVVVTGAAIALARRSRKRSQWFAPQPPSTFGVVAKSVGLWALRLAARNVALAVVARLEQRPATVAPATVALGAGAAGGAQ
jgi:hypothetical protein